MSGCKVSVRHTKQMATVACTPRGCACAGASFAVLMNAHLYGVLRFESPPSFALVEYGDVLRLSQLPSELCVNLRRSRDFLFSRRGLFSSVRRHGE